MFSSISENNLSGWEPSSLGCAIISVFRSVYLKSSDSFVFELKLKDVSSSFDIEEN